MTLIPAEHIARRDDEPIILELDTVGEHPVAPASLLAFTVSMTTEERERMATELRKKVEAAGILMGREAPPEMLSMLEEIENEEQEQKAVLTDTTICWN